MSLNGNYFVDKVTNVKVNCQKVCNSAIKRSNDIILKQNVLNCFHCWINIVNMIVYMITYS